MDISEHGICVDKKRNRVKCNYCGKEVSKFSRLKLHLGGVRDHVLPCEKVPDIVKDTFRKMVMMERARSKRGRSEDSSSKSVSPLNRNVAVVTDKQGLLPYKTQKCIGRYFYENCMDFSVVDSPSFKEMMTGPGSDAQMELKVPTSHDLKGWMLQEALKEVQDHVKKIKDSWAITGCSVLLDAWVDQKGHDLVAFVADCPAGPMYLKSFDVSDIKSDTNALTSLVDGIVEEVGVDNVIQIVACSTSGWVGELGESFAGNKKKGFWSVSVSHCFEIMLKRIGKSDFFDILDNVTKISEFINNNSLVVEFLKDHGHGMTLSSSEFEFVTPYLVLESLFSAKNDLAAMFASSDWNKGEGTTIFQLVNDSSFWETVEIVVKCTLPLIHGLLWLSTLNNQHTGFIYDTMDAIKESIAREFKHDKICYKPLWDVIDDVWSKHLHSRVHAAGYFLNPRVFYSTDFHLDPEVATGLTASMAYMAKDRRIQLKVATQLDMYRLGTDCFSEACQIDQISGFRPAEWWSQNASEHPELQSFAIKILSQTCEGASRYKLKRYLAEKLLFTEGMSYCEIQNLEDLVFVHYNLHLQSCKAKLSEEIVLQDV